MQEEYYYTVREFTKVAGLTKQRLYQLWDEGAGPSRVTVGAASGRTHVLIPKEAGQDWLLAHKRRVAEQRQRQRDLLRRQGGTAKQVREEFAAAGRMRAAR